MIPKIVITSLPTWSSFQWFLLGFFQLQKEGKAKLEFHAGLLSNLSRWIDSYYVFGVGQRYYANTLPFCLQGYVEMGNNRKYFCIDRADSPYLFDSRSLERVNVYFKMQCPKEFLKKGFRLADDVWIPWTDHQHTDPRLGIPLKGERKACKNLFENIEKVRPLMIGPRHLAYGNGGRTLLKGLKHYMASGLAVADKKLMCYFGNSKGPIPSREIDRIDYNWESDLMAKWAAVMSHPNEKRSIASHILQQLGEGYDARVIHEGHSDDSHDVFHKELIVPLKNFCEFVSHFQYNLNISGYRLSIPNRFIESFMVGTAIVTDKLAVKWYKPFGEEVVETVEMGYLPNEKVDWRQFEKDITGLPPVSKEKVLEAFYEKWAPEKVAQYMLNEIMNS